MSSDNEQSEENHLAIKIKLDRVFTSNPKPHDWVSECLLKLYQVKSSSADTVCGPDARETTVCAIFVLTAMMKIASGRMSMRSSKLQLFGKLVWFFFSSFGDKIFCSCMGASIE